MSLIDHANTDHLTHLAPDELHRALTLRDLTDPAQGAHGIQTLLDAVVAALQSTWGCTTRWVRRSPLVPVRDNYDRLGYDLNDVTRARRYTRYVSPTVMLRSHTSALLPSALDDYARLDAAAAVDELIVAPGLVYRRDAVDRTHVGEPHQVDLWRIRNTPTAVTEARAVDEAPAVNDAAEAPAATEAVDASDLLTMIGLVVEAVLPAAAWRVTEVEHPYTVDGLQIDVRHDGEWLELAECGRIHPDVLRGSGLDPAQWSGLALGMGLERALMLRKSIPDIRYLRATDPRIATQMLTLDPWRPVSLLPAARRDISVVVPDTDDEETIGDRIRTALATDADLIESVSVLSRTTHDELPDAARHRLQTRPGQANLLLRIVLRPLDRTLTSDEANTLRNAIYRAVHRGPVEELI